MKTLLTKKSKLQSYHQHYVMRTNLKMARLIGITLKQTYSSNQEINIHQKNYWMQLQFQQMNTLLLQLLNKGNKL